MIKFTASQDSQFEQALRLVPQNAKYTSASIQNEIIFILKDMVLSAISNEMNEQCDLPYYCLKCDGTRDPVNTENLSVIVRYSVDAIVHERLVALSGLEGLSAAHITKQVLEDLQLVGLDPKQILCTCFDGASVMSGSKGGVHALLQKELQKEIPYIHCLNHQLHLVISHVCGKIDEVADMFATCNGLYKFFRKFEVSQLYKGQHLQRLLEIRWTGHLNVCKIILKNYSDIVEVLLTLSKSHGKLSVEAKGYLASVSSVDFIFLCELMFSVLEIFAPANKLLQKEVTNLKLGIDLIQASSQVLQARKNSFDEFVSTLSEKYPQIFGTEDSETSREKRPRMLPRYFDNFVVMERLPNASSTVQPEDREMAWKSQYQAIINETEMEINRRFSEKNSALYHSLNAVYSVNSPEFLKMSHLSELIKLMNLQPDILNGELQVFRSMLTSKNCDTFQKILKLTYEYKAAFPEVYKLFCGVQLFGASTAACENFFSCLQRVLSKQRMSMNHRRKSSLVHLAYESDITNNIKLDEFVEVFRNKHPRRLNL